MKATKDLKEIKIPKHTEVPISLADHWVDPSVAPSHKNAEDQAEIHQYLLLADQRAVRTMQRLTPQLIYSLLLVAHLGLLIGSAIGARKSGWD